MHSQSWMATLAITVIAFGGGFLAGMRGEPVPVAAQSAPKPSELSAAVFFSPKGGCVAAILDQISSAQQTVELQGPVLTSAPIADALAAAKRRGVRVSVLLDAAQTSEHREQARYLVGAQVPVFLDAKHGAADNRVILIDNRIVITGSFTFTDLAELGNADNMLVIHDQTQLQSSFEENFRVHLAHSVPYDGG
jgi:phosphatidylserine/phosphatidylglycerophosphate/cardiolipin synthase-like enzyme